MYINSDSPLYPDAQLGAMLGGARLSGSELEKGISLQAHLQFWIDALPEGIIDPGHLDRIKQDLAQIQRADQAIEASDFDALCQQMSQALDHTHGQFLLPLSTLSEKTGGLHHSLALFRRQPDGKIYCYILDRGEGAAKHHPVTEVRGTKVLHSYSSFPLELRNQEMFDKSLGRRFLQALQEFRQTPTSQDRLYGLMQSVIGRAGSSADKTRKQWGWGENLPAQAQTATPHMGVSIARSETSIDHLPRLLLRERFVQGEIPGGHEARKRLVFGVRMQAAKQISGSARLQKAMIADLQLSAKKLHDAGIIEDSQLKECLALDVQPAPAPPPRQIQLEYGAEAVATVESCLSQKRPAKEGATPDPAVIVQHKSLLPLLQELRKSYEWKEGHFLALMEMIGKNIPEITEEILDTEQFLADLRCVMQRAPTAFRGTIEPAQMLPSMILLTTSILVMVDQVARKDPEYQLEGFRMSPPCHLLKEFYFQTAQEQAQWEAVRTYFGEQRDHRHIFDLMGWKGPRDIGKSGQYAYSQQFDSPYSDGVIHQMTVGDKYEPKKRDPHIVLLHSFFAPCAELIHGRDQVSQTFNHLKDPFRFVVKEDSQHNSEFKVVPPGVTTVEAFGEASRFDDKPKVKAVRKSAQFSSEDFEALFKEASSENALLLEQYRPKSLSRETFDELRLILRNRPMRLPQLIDWCRKHPAKMFDRDIQLFCERILLGEKGYQKEVSALIKEMLGSSHPGFWARIGAQLIAREGAPDQDVQIADLQELVPAHESAILLFMEGLKHTPEIASAIQWAAKARRAPHWMRLDNQALMHRLLRDRLPDIDEAARSLGWQPLGSGQYGVKGTVIDIARLETTMKGQKLQEKKGHSHLNWNPYLKELLPGHKFIQMTKGLFRTEDRAYRIYQRGYDNYAVEKQFDIDGKLVWARHLPDSEMMGKLQWVTEGHGTVLTNPDHTMFAVERKGKIYRTETQEVLLDTKKIALGPLKHMCASKKIRVWGKNGRVSSVVFEGLNHLSFYEESGKLFCKDLPGYCIPLDGIAPFDAFLGAVRLVEEVSGEEALILPHNRMGVAAPLDGKALGLSKTALDKEHPGYFIYRKRGKEGAYTHRDPRAMLQLTSAYMRMGEHRLAFEACRGINEIRYFNERDWLVLNDMMRGKVKTPGLLAMQMQVALLALNNYAQVRFGGARPQWNERQEFFWIETAKRMNAYLEVVSHVPEELRLEEIEIRQIVRFVKSFKPRKKEEVPYYRRRKAVKPTPASAWRTSRHIRLFKGWFKPEEGWNAPRRPLHVMGSEFYLPKILREPPHKYQDGSPFHYQDYPSFTFSHQRSPSEWAEMASEEIGSVAPIDIDLYLECEALYSQIPELGYLPGARMDYMELFFAAKLRSVAGKIPPKQPGQSERAYASQLIRELFGTRLHQTEDRTPQWRPDTTYYLDKHKITPLPPAQPIEDRGAVALHPIEMKDPEGRILELIRLGPLPFQALLTCGVRKIPTVADVLLAFNPDDPKAILRLNPHLTNEQLEELYSACVQVMAAAAPCQGFDPYEHWQLALYQYMSGLTLRRKPDQVRLLQKIFAIAFESGKKAELNQLFFEFQAGGGKTKVVSVIIAMEAMRRGLRPVFFSLPELVDISQDDLRSCLAEFFRKKTRRINLSLGVTPSNSDLKELLTEIRHTRGTTCDILTPEGYHTLQLEYYKALDQYDSFSEYTSQRIQLLDKVLGFYEDYGVFLVDEGHRNASSLLQAITAFGTPQTIPEPYRLFYLQVFRFLAARTGLRDNQQAAMSSDERNGVLIDLARHLLPQLQLTEEALRYLTDAEADPPKEVEALFSAEEAASYLRGQKIALLRGMITQVLPFTLAMKGGIDHGPSVDRQTEVEAPRDNQRTTTAKFESADVAMALTIQGFLQRGLTSNEQIKRLIRWVSEEKPAAPADWQQMILRNEKGLLSKLGQREDVIWYYLERGPLADVSILPAKLCSTASNLAFGSRASIMFSATLGAMEKYPFHGTGKEYLQDTEFLRRVEERALEPDNDTVLLHEGEMTPSRFFQRLFSSGRENIVGLVDYGGMCPLHSTGQWARSFLKIARQHRFDGVVSSEQYRGKKRLCLRLTDGRVFRLQGSDLKAELQRLGLADQRIFKLFGPSDFTGTDLPIEKGGVIALTIGEGACFDEIAQAALRARGFLRSEQSVIWNLPESLAPIAGTKRDEILAWAKQNQQEREKAEIVARAYQEIEGISTAKRRQNLKGKSSSKQHDIFKRQREQVVKSHGYHPAEQYGTAVRQADTTEVLTRFALSLGLQEDAAVQRIIAQTAQKLRTISTSSSTALGARSVQRQQTRSRSRARQRTRQRMKFQRWEGAPLPLMEQELPKLEESLPPWTLAAEWANFDGVPGELCVAPGAFDLTGEEGGPLKRCHHLLWVEDEGKKPYGLALSQQGALQYLKEIKQGKVKKGRSVQLFTAGGIPIASHGQLDGHGVDLALKGIALLNGEMFEGILSVYAKDQVAFRDFWRGLCSRLVHSNEVAADQLMTMIADMEGETEGKKPEDFVLQGSQKRARTFSSRSAQDIDLPSRARAARLPMEGDQVDLIEARQAPVIPFPPSRPSPPVTFPYPTVSEVAYVSSQVKTVGPPEPSRVDELPAVDLLVQKGVVINADRIRAARRRRDRLVAAIVDPAAIGGPTGVAPTLEGQDLDLRGRVQRPAQRSWWKIGALFATVVAGLAVVWRFFKWPRR